MRSLADFVIKAADNCSEVRTWLLHNREFVPKEINHVKIYLSGSESEEQKEETKEASIKKDRIKALIFDKYPSLLVKLMSEQTVKVSVMTEPPYQDFYQVECAKESKASV